MKKLALLLFAAAALCAAPALADEVWVTLHGKQPDALMPDASGFSGELTGADEADFAAIVMGAFPEIYHKDVRARMFEEAAFSGVDDAMAIQEHDGRFRVVAAQSTKWLWNYTQNGRDQASQYREVLKPADYHDVRIKRCSVVIDQKLGTKIVNIWQAMLLHVVRADFVTPPLDAPWLYFSAPSSKGTLAGQIWSPFNAPRVSSLTSIAFGLQDYCMTKNRSVLPGIRTEVDQLADLLASDTGK